MSNVLRVTTPLTGYDNMPHPKTDMGARENSKIQGPVNPEKVMRPDARSDSAAEEQNVGLKFQYQSNFENFISQMKAGGSVTEEFTSLFFERMGTLVKAGMGENTAQELARFMELIQVEPQNMLSFIQEQSSASIRFQGAFFSVLRQVMKESKNVELKAGTLEFVKRYTDMAEGEHILREIKQTLQEIKGSMFANGRERLEELEGRMEYAQSAGKGDTNQKASVIKEQILPYLNQYINSTHDRGELRENSVLLAALTARYENGEASRVQEKFEELMEYPLMQKYFKGLEPKDLMRVLASTDFEKAVERNEWMKEFASVIKDGITKGTNPEHKQVFRNMLTAILLNESVYMPVLHLMLPMQVEDKLMFAEMWIDPDAGGRTREEGQERAIQGLVKFDIRDVGFFDLFFVYQNNKVNLQLNYPEALRDKEDEIRSRIAGILAENGLESEELFLGSSMEPIPVSEAFPQIFERKNSINVKI